jgi:hypothetical protein
MSGNWGVNKTAQKAHAVSMSMFLELLWSHEDLRSKGEVSHVLRLSKGKAKTIEG